MSRRFLAALGAAVAVLGLVALPAASAGAAPSPAPAAAAAQTLTWTASNSTTEYASAPTTAVAGETTIVFETSEATGNTTGMSHTLNFDTSSPGYNHDVNVAITANPFDADNGHHEQTVTLTPGRYRYFCTIPGHSTMTGEFTVTGGGGEDTTPPSVSATVTGDQDTSGNYVGSATVAVSASDTGSGVSTVEYQLDGGTYQTYSAPVQVSTVGSHTVKYRATDNAGNTSTEGTTTFNVVAGGGDDTTPPTVSGSVAGAQDSSGNYVGSATVTVTAADSGSGVSSIEYQVNDLGWNPYTQPFQVTTPSQYTVLLRATDAAGNVGNGQVAFTVVEAPSDTTPPAVNAEVSGSQDSSGNYLDSATVTISATDTGSGVASTEYKLDAGAWTAYGAPVVVNTPGEHMVSYRATDVAGNVSDEGMAMFTIVQQDTTAPVASGQVAGQQDQNGAYVGSAVVTLTATDAGSGVASIEYKLDSGAFTAYSAPVQVSTLGAHTLQYRATDVAGNVSTVGTLTFTVVSGGTDTTAPSVSAVVSGNQNSNWQYIDGATITLSALDTGSGVGSIEYALDGGAWTVYTTPVAVDSEGAHTFKYRATDKAGNVSPELSGGFTIVEDSSGPTPDVCPSSDVRDTVIIGESDSQVPNVDTGNGCTINDLIDEDGEYASANDFIRWVKSVTKELVQNGVIDSDARNRIVAAAIDSGVGGESAARV